MSPQDSQKISITLTRRQIAVVVSQTAADQAYARAEDSIPDSAELEAVVSRMVDDKRYAGSLLRAMRIFAALPQDGRSLTITELAARLNAPRATVHRYMQTFVGLRMVTQDASSRRYARITHRCDAVNSQ